MVLGAVLLESSPLAFLRTPLSIASFIYATPDTWMPLGAVVVLAAAGFASEIAGRTPRSHWIGGLLTGIVVVTGVVWYFRAGDVDWFATQDWVKEWTYYTALRESLQRGELPWFLNEPFQGTPRYFANAETIVSPLGVLLKWLDVSTFVVARAVVLMIAGLVSAYYLTRDLRLGPVASLAFLAIFLMNGHVIAHLETGHLQWISYWLLPAVLLFIHRAATGNMSPRTLAGLALSLALIVVEGGWHPYVWSLIFIGAFVIGGRSRWRFGVLLALLVAGLSAIRLIPGAALYEMTEREFVGSYQSLETLIGALTTSESRRIVDGLNWWEYNTFVGWIGFALVLTGLTAPLTRVWQHSVSTLWAPSVAMLVLSCYNLYQWTLFRLPGFVSQRVASRLLVVGVLGFTLIACVQLNSWLSRHARSRWRIVMAAAAALLLAAQLVAHLNSRRPRPNRGVGAPAVNIVSPQPPEAVYVWSVAGGGLVTLISLGIAGSMWRRPC